MVFVLGPRVHRLSSWLAAGLLPVPRPWPLPRICNARTSQLAGAAGEHRTRALLRAVQFFLSCSILLRFGVRIQYETMLQYSKSQRTAQKYRPLLLVILQDIVAHLDSARLLARASNT